MSNATRQFARVLHDTVTTEQRYSSSPATAQQFLAIQENPGDFLTHGTNANRPPIPAECSMESALAGPATSSGAATADRPSGNGRLERQELYLVNYQFQQIVRDDGLVASVTNERRVRQGFGCKTGCAALSAASNCSPLLAKAARWLIPQVFWAITLDVVVRLARAQLQAWLLSRVSLRTIPLKRFVNPSLLHGEPCFPVAAVSSRKPPSMQTRDTARLA
ncbi:hypothetical protein [Bradyrhizobium sp. USDA 4486]